MSLINDALNKVQRDRRAAAAAAADGLERPSPQTSAQKAKAPARFPPWMWVGINAIVLVSVLGINHFFFQDEAANQPQPTKIVKTAPSAPAPVPAVEPVEFAAPVVSAPKTISTSPFISMPSTGAAQLAADVEYDLAGMTVVGKDTLLSIMRRSDQRSFWVPVGKTVGEVTAVSYNAEADDAIIRVRGQTMKIVMRNAAVFFRPVTPPAR